MLFARCLLQSADPSVMRFNLELHPGNAVKGGSRVVLRYLLEQGNAGALAVGVRTTQNINVRIFIWDALLDIGPGSAGIGPNDGIILI